MLQQHQAIEIPKIAANIGAKNYFLSHQQQNFDEWADRSSQIFRVTGEVLRAEYELKSESILDAYSNDYDDNYSRCKKQFDAFCILNRKVFLFLLQVQKKNDQIQNLANHWSEKATKKTFFQVWKGYSDKSKYLRQMDDRAEKYQKQRVMKNVIKQWLKITMDSNKTKIKNDVLQKTQIQVFKVQSEYEKLIKSLEETLEKKLNQLKKEQQEHRLLHDKYEAMHSRSPVEQASSRRN